MTVNEQEQSLEDTQSGKFLTFSLDGDEFGVEIKYVTEIIGMQPITELPEVPDYIQGDHQFTGKNHSTD